MGTLAIQSEIIITGSLNNQPSAELQVDQFGSILNLGVLVNEGTVNMSSTVLSRNFNQLDNLGIWNFFIFMNHGEIHNFPSSQMNCNSLFYNQNLINNKGSIQINSSFYNQWNLQFDVVFYNCVGTVSGNAITGVPIEESTCVFPEICDGIDNDLDGQTDEDCGCSDSLACNYTPGATLDDGSCNYNCSGCTNPGACNYFAAANTDDGSCTFPGCTVVSACNYDPNANCEAPCDFISCRGCTGEKACNYTPTASIDDGSCEYLTCAGCTYLTSINYNPAKSLDDGSCDFNLASTCPSDLNNDNETDATDLLAFLGAFGQTCTP